jgi:hypothetical protein
MIKSKFEKNLLQSLVIQLKPLKYWTNSFKLLTFSDQLSGLFLSVKNVGQMTTNLKLVLNFKFLFFLHKEELGLNNKS